MSDMMFRPVLARRSPTPGPSWIDALDGYLTCTEIVEVTHDVKSFSFELPGRVSLRFLAGQYLTFRLLIDRQRVERCYTLTSTPTRPGRLTITVKRTAGGVVSTWLHRNLRVGDAVGASGPFGQFSCAIHPAEKYLFLTAGSGITPAMSMLRTLCDGPDPVDVVVVHCARTPEDIIFRDELADLASRSGVTVVVLCSRDSPAERWQGLRGRLSFERLHELVPDLIDREVFTCGPQAYRDSVRTMLERSGADPQRCHEESFSVGTAHPTSEAHPSLRETHLAAAATTHTVDFHRSGRSIECDAETTILEAAARAGITLPSSCAEGMCGTCKLSLLRGQVDMQHAGGIRPREITQGKILPCCSTPLEDIEIDA